MKKLLLATCVAVLTFVAVLPANQAVVRRFGFDDFSKVKRVSDPQFSPDGSALVYVVSTPNLDENRHMASLHRMAVAGGTAQLLVDGTKYVSVSFPRWSPNGRLIAFLSTGPVPGQPGSQIFVIPSSGGDIKQLTTAQSAVQQIAWSPDSSTIGFAAADVPDKKPGYQRWNDSFEVQLNFHLFMTAPVPPTHVWTVPVSGGNAKRLTSGEWTLPVTRPPGAPSSMITWTPDGSAIVFARNGGGVPGGLQSVTVADGTIKPLNLGGTFPVYSAKGDQIAFLNNGAAVAPAGGGQAKNLTQPIDRGIARVLWMPDGTSLVVGANDTERVSLWQQPLDGAAKKLDTGDVSPNSSFFVDMAVSSTGAIAFSGTSPTRPGELYLKASPEAPVKRLTGVNDEIASLPLGKSEVVSYTFDKFDQNGILDVSAGFRSLEEVPTRAADSWRSTGGVPDDLQCRRAVDGRKGLAGVSAELPRQRQSRPPVSGRDFERRGRGSRPRRHGWCGCPQAPRDRRRRENGGVRLVVWRLHDDMDAG